MTTTKAFAVTVVEEAETAADMADVLRTRGVALPHKAICKARMLAQQRRLEQCGKRYEWELGPEQAATSAAEEHALIVQLAHRYGLGYRPSDANSERAAMSKAS